jgi:hypothetical protein
MIYSIHLGNAVSPRFGKKKQRNLWTAGEPQSRLIRPCFDRHHQPIIITVQSMYGISPSRISPPIINYCDTVYRPTIISSYERLLRGRNTIRRTIRRCGSLMAGSVGLGGAGDRRQLMRVCDRLMNGLVLFFGGNVGLGWSMWALFSVSFVGAAPARARAKHVLSFSSLFHPEGTKGHNSDGW